MGGGAGRVLTKRRDIYPRRPKTGCICLLEDGPIIGGGGGGGAFHWKLTLYEDNQETNTHFNSQQTQVYFINKKC